MRASFGSGPLIFSPRGLGFDVKISRSGGEGICPFWRYPLTSVAATRLSQLSDLRYISREAFRDTISLQLTAVLWCLFSQSTTDRIGKVLGGALTHTQIINLHINSHGSVCFRFNFCVWNIDDSTIMWPLSHWGGKEKRQIKSWSMYQTATAVWSEPRWKRIFPWKLGTTQRCMCRRWYEANANSMLWMTTRTLRAAPMVDYDELVDIRVFPLIRVIVGPLSMVTYYRVEYTG